MKKHTERPYRYTKAGYIPSEAGNPYKESKSDRLVIKGVIAKNLLRVIEISILLILVIFMVALGFSAKAETTDAWLDEGYQSWSPELVKRIQTALNNYLSKTVEGYQPLKVDGIFGADTGTYVMMFQAKKGLTVDGICGKNTLSAMGIMDTGEHPRYIADRRKVFSRSGNGRAIYIPLLKGGDYEAYYYERTTDGWKLVETLKIAVGNFKKGTPTPFAASVLTGEGNHEYIHDPEDTWRGYNATYFKHVPGRGKFFFHSILKLNKSGEWRWQGDSVLGTACSHGCIRLGVDDSEWHKNFATAGTVVVIDARKN